jgi:hypothetical protein
MRYEIRMNFERYSKYKGKLFFNVVFYGSKLQLIPWLQLIHSWHGGKQTRWDEIGETEKLRANKHLTGKWCSLMRYMMASVFS